MKQFLKRKRWYKNFQSGLNHYLKWKRWRKNCRNGIFYKLGVLLGFIYSPSFEWNLSGEQHVIPRGCIYCKDII